MNPSNNCNPGNFHLNEIVFAKELCNSTKLSVYTLIIEKLFESIIQEFVSMIEFFLEVEGSVSTIILDRLPPDELRKLFYASYVFRRDQAAFLIAPETTDKVIHDILDHYQVVSTKLDRLTLKAQESFTLCTTDYKQEIYEVLNIQSSILQLKSKFDKLPDDLHWLE